MKDGCHNESVGGGELNGNTRTDRTTTLESDPLTQIIKMKFLQKGSVPRKEKNDSAESSPTHSNDIDYNAIHVPIIRFLRTKIGKGREHDIQRLGFQKTAVLRIRQRRSQLFLDFLSFCQRSVILDHFHVGCKLSEFVEPVGQHGGGDDDEVRSAGVVGIGRGRSGW